MIEVKVGADVMIHGRVKEIIIGEKETLYKIIINKIDPPNSCYNEVLVRPKDIVE